MRVLLVPANFHGAEGALANFAANHCKGIDALFFRASDISSRRDEFLELVNQVDVVHWIMNLSNIPGLDGLNWKDFSCASVATVHHVLPDEGNKITFAKKTNLIHAVSSQWLNILSGGPVPVSLALGGADYPRLSALQKKSRPQKVFRFGMFGVLRPRKRVDFFREALLRMKSKNFQVVFQGFGWEKEKKTFEDSGISVRILGGRPSSEAWKAYGEIDCYVCSSDVEGGPLGILEALSSGVPVVSTKVGVASEVLSSGGGAVTEVNDLPAFSRALERMVSDNDYYEKRVKECVLLGEQYFKTIAEDYFRMYSRAIEIRRASGAEIRIFREKEKSFFENQRKNELSLDLVSEALFFLKNGNLGPGLRLFARAFFSFRLNFFWLLKQVRFGAGEFFRRNVFSNETENKYETK